MLWELQSNMASQYFNTWSTCVKLAWGLPRDTHTYFLDYLSGGLVSARVDILGRYLGFYRSLLSSPSREVTILARIVAKDIRSTTAKNLRLLEVETDGMTWSASNPAVKKKLLQSKLRVPLEEEWRIKYLGKLLEQRDQLRYAGQEDHVQVELVQSLMDSLCSS